MPYVVYLSQCATLRGRCFGAGFTREASLIRDTSYRLLRADGKNGVVICTTKVSPTGLDLRRRSTLVLRGLFENLLLLAQRTDHRTPFPAAAAPSLAGISTTAHG